MDTMTIIIDQQRVLDLPYEVGRNEDGEQVVVLPFTSAHDLLTQWKFLDNGRRDFRYGGSEDDSAPSTIIVAWATHHGSLSMTDIDPFWGEMGQWPGLDTWNGYALEGLAEGLPIEALQWGPEIGEPDPIHPGESVTSGTLDLLDPDEREI